MYYLASPAQLRASTVRWLLVTVPLVVGLGWLSGAVAGSGPGNGWFDALAKPAIYPPPVTFAVVWTALYLALAVALALVLAARGARLRRAAALAFGAQFALNLAWSPLFFAGHRITAALALLLVLVVAAGVTAELFRRVRPLAGWLLLPYLAWLMFASALNWEFLRLNPGADGQPDSGAAVRIRL